MCQRAAGPIGLSYYNEEVYVSFLVYIDYNMLFNYGYCRWQNWWWRTNAPRPPAVLIATAVRRSNTDGIAQCGMFRATPEATGRRHRATTCYILPQRPLGQQANKQQSTNTPKKVAFLMAMAMRRYVTARITRWRRSRASLEATGSRHRASIMSDNINQTWLWCFFDVFIVKTIGKGHGLMLRLLFLTGVRHINQNRRAWLRWVYIVFGGSSWQSSICQSGYPIAFRFVRTMSRSCVSDNN
jgi:hypothetical protein